MLHIITRDLQQLLEPSLREAGKKMKPSYCFYYCVHNLSSSSSSPLSGWLAKKRRFPTALLLLLRVYNLKQLLEPSLRVACENEVQVVITPVAPEA
jgi:hypothetical protein